MKHSKTHFLLCTSFSDEVSLTGGYPLIYVQELRSNYELILTVTYGYFYRYFCNIEGDGELYCYIQGLSTMLF